MAIPSNAAGAGNNSSARNVFRIVFSQNLSANPSLESWDDATFSTTNKEQFAGTVQNGNNPSVAGVATTDAAPLAAWKPAAPAGGGATINRLKGLASYVILSSAIPVAGGAVSFNINFEIPSDATVPSINTYGVLACRFSFSGPTPTLTWQFNDVSAGGTEGAPSWTNLTPGAAGNFIRPADAGSTSASVVVTKPASAGVLDAAQVWVTNT
jgi:hypothetical protein